MPKIVRFLKIRLTVTKTDGTPGPAGNRADQPAAAAVPFDRGAGGGVPCCAFHGKASSEACCGFPGRLRRKFGRVLSFPDSAPRHKPEAVREYLEKTNGGIQMRHSPPHAPGPSPAGGRWRLVKKATADAPCRDTDDMAGAIRMMMMSGEIAMAKLSRYLTL